MTEPIQVLASGAASALLFMLRDGAVDIAFIGGSLVLLFVVAIAKGMWFARAAGVGTGRAVGGALLAGLLSLLGTAAVALGVRDQRLIVFVVPVLLISVAVGSARFGRVLPDSPWDLLTPARLGLLHVVGVMMAAVWIAFAAGIEPSISPRNFHLFRGVLQFIALLVCCAIAGAWDGPMLCTIAAKERMPAAVSAAVRSNLVILVLGIAAIIWDGGR